MKINLNSSKDLQKRIASKPRRHCPFVANPFDECFIARINSQNIDQAIYYCGNDFEECEIYRSHNQTGTSVK